MTQPDGTKVRKPHVLPSTPPVPLTSRVTTDRLIPAWLGGDVPFEEVELVGDLVEQVAGVEVGVPGVVGEDLAAGCLDGRGSTTPIEDLFERQLPGGPPPTERAHEAAAATFTPEGAVIHYLDLSTTRRLSSSVAERLQQASVPPGTTGPR